MCFRLQATAMTYQVLARRWRPQRFEDLVGQEVVVRTLHNALASRQVAHAYLFSGLRGVGKTTAARLLAKALNCEHGPTPEPCGSCLSCEEITAGRSPDVQEIDAASNRGIDEVRRLIDVARVMPLRDRYRVFILDEAHQITPDAFNALLKLLEEPPAHVVFILASTARHRFPATILSRCQQLDFRPIPLETIVERLTDIAAADGFSLDAEAAQLVARAAEGSLRDALSLLDRVRAFSDGAVTQQAVSEVLGLPSTEVLLSLWTALEAADVARALAMLREEEAAGRDPRALYERVIELLQALLLLACDASAPVPFTGAHHAAIAAAAARLGAPVLLRLATLALEQRSLVASADRPGVAVAVAIGRLALWPRLMRVEALLAGEPAPMPSPSAARGGTAPPAGAGPSLPPAAPPSDATPPSGTKERLVEALEALDQHGLAARIGMATEVTATGDELVVRLGAVPPATVQSLRDGSEQLSRAALRAHLPERIRLDAGSAALAEAQGLRARVEADEAVQRVLRVFGGRIERIEEQT
jgi:DNA polymerase III subunit gamma/tau